MKCATSFPLFGRKPSRSIPGHKDSRDQPPAFLRPLLRIPQSDSLSQDLLDILMLRHYASAMQRDTYNTVTVPILIRSSKAWAEGEAFWDDLEEGDERVLVREFTEDDSDQSIPCGKETWNQLSDLERRQIVRVGDVLRAMKSKDADDIEKAMLTLKSSSLLIARLMKEPGFVEESLVLELCRNLYDVRLVMWKRKNGLLAPGLLCPNVRSAFWILTLWSAVGMKAGPRLCPRCGLLFGQKRPDQDYCSIECREAHRVDRWRKKKRSDGAGRKMMRTSRGSKK
jgi:hypothetical protein